MRARLVALFIRVLTAALVVCGATSYAAPAAHEPAVAWMVDSAQLDSALQLDTLQLDSAQLDTLQLDTPRIEQEQRSTVPEVFKDSARLALEAKSRRAWRRSMFVPGWGQITNGGIWWIKVPVIYGGFVSTALIFEFNQRHYRIVLKDVQYRVSNNHALPPNSAYDYIGADPQGTEYLISWKDYHRRMRDISILATVGWYALNIIEAYVDSMLKTRWEIGDDLTFRLTPTVLPSASFAYQRPTIGFNLKLNLH